MKLVVVMERVLYRFSMDEYTALGDTSMRYIVSKPMHFHYRAVPIAFPMGRGKLNIIMEILWEHMFMYL